MKRSPKPAPPVLADEDKRVENARGGWTGPRDEDLDAAGHIIAPPLPAERWPYCWPSEHQACCVLHEGGRFCDCLASDESDGDAAELELPE